MPLFLKKILFVKMSLAETFLSATNTTASEGKIRLRFCLVSAFEMRKVVVFFVCLS